MYCLYWLLFVLVAKMKTIDIYVSPLGNNSNNGRKRHLLKR